MRISDWSSDVCSSDLGRGRRHGILHRQGRLGRRPSGVRSNRYQAAYGELCSRILGQRLRTLPCRIQGGTHAETGNPLQTGADRKSVVSGKSVSVRVDLGGRSTLKKKKIETKRI